MEKEYEKFVHHVCTLITNRKFVRAIAIINYIFSQGIKTAELIVMLSYAIKMIDGLDKAIEGPLIQYVKAEYRKEMGNIGKTKAHLQRIVNNEIQGQIGDVYSSIQIMNNPNNGNNKPPIYEIENHENYEQINRSNQITQKYRKKEISKEMAREQYLKILQNSQDLENELKQQIIKNIKYLK